MTNQCSSQCVCYALPPIVILIIFIGANKNVSVIRSNHYTSEMM